MKQSDSDRTYNNKLLENQSLGVVKVTIHHSDNQSGI